MYLSTMESARSAAATEYAYEHKGCRTKYFLTCTHIWRHRHKQRMVVSTTILNGNFHYITTNPFEFQILNKPTELVLDLFQAAPDYLLLTNGCRRKKCSQQNCLAIPPTSVRDLKLPQHNY